jgi:rhodanese-related sulfurtransferase
MEIKPLWLAVFLFSVLGLALYFNHKTSEIEVEMDPLPTPTSILIDRGSYKIISLSQAQTSMDKDSVVLINLDQKDDEEELGIYISLAELKLAVYELDKTKNYILLSDDVEISKQASEILLDEGFGTVYIVDKDIQN